MGHHRLSPSHDRLPVGQLEEVGGIMGGRGKGFSGGSGGAVGISLPWQPGLGQLPTTCNPGKLFMFPKLE